jgi:hypothetical protein
MEDKIMTLTTPGDQSLSPYTGWTRTHWEEVFRDLIKGAVKYSTPDKGYIHFPGGKASMYGPQSDGMEGVARVFWMVGPYLHHRQDGLVEIDGQPYDIAAHFRQAIASATNITSPEFWGEIKPRHQSIVEAAAMAINMFLSRHLIWDKMTTDEQDKAAFWLQTAIGKEPYMNNWVLFKVVINTFLKLVGKKYSEKEINAGLDFVARLYHGDGWYRDGKEPCFDYYNAWALHPYFLLWAYMDGASRPDLVEVLKARTTEFLGNYKYFFAGNGLNVPFGRSLLYRFAACSVFPVAELFGISPVPPGQARRICSGNVKYFVENGALEDHHLTMGFLKENLNLPEMYSGQGSPYWAAKAFWVFLLKADHPFWTAPEEPLEVEKDDYIVSIPSTGQIVQGVKDGGQVTVFVNNSQHWAEKKYSNFSFSSHFGFEIGHVNDTYNFDGGLFPSLDGKKFITRQYPHHIATADHFSASYFMPFKVDPAKPWPGNFDMNTRIYTNLIVKDDFHIRLHQVESDKNFMLYDGGMALGYNEGQPEIKSGKGWEYCAINNKVSFIKNLAGYTNQVQAKGFQDNPQGNNLIDDFSIVPALLYHSDKVAGKVLASLVVATLKPYAPHELDKLVTVFRRIKNNFYYIRFYDNEEVYTQVGGDCKACTVKLPDGSTITDRILCVRIDVAQNCFVIYADGTLKKI